MALLITMEIVEIRLERRCMDMQEYARPSKLDFNWDVEDVTVAFDGGSCSVIVIEENKESFVVRFVL